LRLAIEIWSNRPTILYCTLFHVGEGRSSKLQQRRKRPDSAPSFGYGHKESPSFVSRQAFHILSTVVLVSAALVLVFVAITMVPIAAALVFVLVAIAVFPVSITLVPVSFTVPVSVGPSPRIFLTVVD
jgi:hypothetical protein